jgi:hypothetical protein
MTRKQHRSIIQGPKIAAERLDFLLHIQETIGSNVGPVNAMLTEVLVFF